jgi:hypothetical protein
MGEEELVLTTNFNSSGLANPPSASSPEPPIGGGLFL